jgi:hypothetical protein
VCVTDDRDDARARIAADYQVAGRVPEYQAMLDREGVAGPEDVAAVGEEIAVERHLRRLADAGATEVAAAPFGTPDERARTLGLLGEARRLR